MFYITGLGNPGDEYIDSRHNTGRDAVSYFKDKYKFSDWTLDKKLNALMSLGKIGKEKISLILPETFMNKSGIPLKKLIKNQKEISNLVVVHDDLDLSLGRIKISFNRGSGGHKGVESIEKNLKSSSFIRVRIGVSQANKSGKPKKLHGEEKVIDFILGKFKKGESLELKNIYKMTAQVLEDIITNGLQRAMGEWNKS